MADRVEISNLTLSKLGEDDQLEDPLDNRKPARSINAVWDMVRDMVLRAHLWNFAIDPGGLELSHDANFTASALSDWRYRFRLPTDFIRLDLQNCRPRWERGDVQIGRQHLYANIPGPVHILYVSRVENCGDWDPLFVEAFACRLAFQVADRLTGDRGRKSDCWQAYSVALKEAKGIDGRENPPQPSEATGWEMARYDGGYGSDPARWG